MSDVKAKLGYGIPNDTSVVVNRTTKVCDVFGNHPDQTDSFRADSYSDGQIFTCTFPAGTDYVDPRRSFLSFEVFSALDAEKVNFFGVHGSACNFFESVTVFSRSGQELCRTENFNLLKNMLLQYQYSRQWFQRQGAAMWYGSRIFSSPQTCVIPLYVLSPLFAFDKLLPAALVSGMRVEIKMAPNTAMIGGVAVGEDIFPVNPLSWSVGEIQYNLEMVKLGDHIRTAMDGILATKGVELVYSGWHHASLYSRTGMVGETTVSISDSYSRALRAFARVRPVHLPQEGKNGSVEEEGQRDSFRGEHVFPVSRYQWRHGDRYHPDKPVSGGGGRIIIKSMQHLLNAVDQLDGNREQTYGSLAGDYNMSEITEDIMDGNLSAGSGVGFALWYQVFPGKIGSYIRDGHLLGVDLTRDSDVKISGRPINNVDPLSLTFTCIPDTLELTSGGEPMTITPARRVDIFLQYVKLVRIFTNNVEIEK